MYVLLPEPLNWTPADIERLLHDAGLEVRVEPDAFGDDAPVGRASVDWDWCEIRWRHAPEDAPHIEVSRSTGLPSDIGDPCWPESLADTAVAETLGLEVYYDWEEPQLERCGDLLALAVLDEQPAARIAEPRMVFEGPGYRSVVEGDDIWPADEYRRTLTQRDYSRTGTVRRALGTSGYPRDRVTEMDLPLPRDIVALAVPLPDSTTAICCVVAPERATTPEERTAVRSQVDEWLMQNDAAYFAWIADPEDEVQRRKVVTPHCSFTEHRWHAMPDPCRIGAFSLLARHDRRFLALNDCAFSEFAAVFESELRDRWLLIVEYAWEPGRLPRHGETIRRLWKTLHSAGERDAIVGVWNPDDNLVWSVPRTDIDLGEYLRGVLAVPAVSLTPWVACVRFSEFLSCRDRVPSFGNLVWLDVPEPPPLAQLSSMGLYRPPERWTVYEARAAEWAETLSSRFLYHCHDDEWLACFVADGEHARRLAAFGFQRACGYRCPAAARTFIPNDLAEVFLDRGVVCPGPAAPTGDTGCAIEFLRPVAAWGDPGTELGTPDEDSPLYLVSYDAGESQWSLRAPPGLRLQGAR